MFLKHTLNNVVFVAEIGMHLGVGSNLQSLPARRPLLCGCHCLGVCTLVPYSWWPSGPLRSVMLQSANCVKGHLRRDSEFWVSENLSLTPPRRLRKFQHPHLQTRVTGLEENSGGNGRTLRKSHITSSVVQRTAVRERSAHSSL